MSAVGVRTRLQAVVDGVADRWLTLRNRMLCSPAFQRWATRSVLARPIARRRASALFDLSAGFVYSQILYSAVRLGLLETLQHGPLTTAELAPRLQLSIVAAQRLLDAAAALQLVQRRGPRYALGIHGCSYVGNPALARLVEHNAMLYRDLVDPVAVLRGEAPPAELNRFWSYASPTSPRTTVASVAPYTELMAASIPLLAQDILSAYGVARHRRLLDVGGGEGAFIEAAAAHAPGLELMLFDLPGVAARASDRLARAGLSERVRVTPGDWFRDPLPEGADLVSLVRVLHDHDDDGALILLRAIRAAIRPGGVLLVAEPMRDDRDASRVCDAYFAFYLLAMGQGRPRSSEQLLELLSTAGFDRGRVQRTPRPMLCGLISARAS